ncbi:MAG: hypothetical protein ACOH5I_23085 [Oligoflexus sp.]
MKKKLALLILAPSLFLAACGDSDDDDKGPIEEVQDTTANLLQNHNLVGDWTAGCAGFDGFGDVVDVSTKETITFGGNNLTKTYTLYEDAECQNPAGELIYEGNYELAEDEQERDNYIELDANIKNVKVKPNSEFLVDAFNAISWCGISDWAQDQVSEITQTLGEGACQLPVDVNTETYSLVYVDGDTLHLSNPLTAAPTAEGERPNEVDREVTFNHAD